MREPGAIEREPTEPEPTEPVSVLGFWFSDRARSLWFEKDSAFDAEIRARFGLAVEQARDGAFRDWCRNGEGALALILLLDQMPRNIHRGDLRAFAADARALAVARAAIAAGFDRGFPFPSRRFFYLPHEHSENLADQDRSIDLFAILAAEVPEEHRAGAEEQLLYAHRHRDIIRRFGRYPHRNAALGRACTAEEIGFLAGPDSSF